VSHGDIATPGSFSSFDSSDDSLVIGTDRHGDGSNVVSVPTEVGFRFAYGQGSFERHRQEAERCGITVRVATDVEMQLDVDTPQDLALYRQALS